MKNHDLATDAYADYVNSQMNVDNYLTYMAAQIFLANHDGPGHNCKFWRAQNSGRYRWLLYDTDHTLGMRLFIPNFRFAPHDGFMDNTIAYYREEDGPNWPNPPESTFIFRKILENEQFRFLFINKLADYLNTSFQPTITVEKLNQVKNRLDPEISKQLSRWGGHMGEWRRNVEYVEDFLTERIAYLQDHVIDEFRLGGLAEVTLNIEPAGAGQINLNSLYLKNNWTGMYFQDVPLSINAIPNIGHKFSGWKELTDTPSTITPNGDITLTARFEKTDEQDVIVINEINYNSSPDFDTGDWIELYNPQPHPVDLSNWRLADDDSRADFIFPANTSLDGRTYLVIAREIEAFSAFHPNPFVIGDLSFGLNSGGDFIILFNHNGQVIDSLTYDNSTPWPWQPDGDGATLALRDANFDNSIADNWMASFAHGTPGDSNRIIGQVENDIAPDKFVLKPAYPNPFNSSTRIDFNLPREQYVKLSIYDILGRKVRIIVDEKLAVGAHSFTWNSTDDNAERAASGVYMVVLTTDGRHHIEKVALIY